MNDSTNRSPRHGATHQTPNSRQKSPGLSISTGSGVNGSPVPRQNGTQGLGLQIGADRAGQANGSPEERRSSVYLPIDDSVSRAGLSVESQAWLFPDHGDHDSNPPKSPSQVGSKQTLLKLRPLTDTCRYTLCMPNLNSLLPSDQVHYRHTCRWNRQMRITKEMIVFPWSILTHAIRRTKRMG